MKSNKKRPKALFSIAFKELFRAREFVLILDGLKFFGCSQELAFICTQGLTLNRRSIQNRNFNTLRGKEFIECCFVLLESVFRRGHEVDCIPTLQDGGFLGFQSCLNFFFVPRTPRLIFIKNPIPNTFAVSVNLIQLSIKSNHCLFNVGSAHA